MEGDEEAEKATARRRSMRNWRCRRERRRVFGDGPYRDGLLLLVLIALLLLLSCSQYCRAEDTVGDEKAPPEKGLDCPSLDSVDSILLVPCDPLIPQKINPNAFDLTLYAALPPFTPGNLITNPLAYLLVNFLDHALPPYEINYPDEEKRGKLLSFLGTFLPPRRTKRPQDVVANVVLANANQVRIRTSQSSWWWEYRLVFECVYGTAAINSLPDQNVTAGADIIDIVWKQRIRDDVDREIQTLGHILQVVDLHRNSRGILGFAVDDPRITSPPFVFRRPTGRGESELPPILPVGPDLMGRDGASRTDWYPAVGAILWVIVAVVFTTLTHLAGLRHRQRYPMDLTTPDGVESLLDVRWWQDHDDTIHIYHRRRRRHRTRQRPGYDKQNPSGSGPNNVQTRGEVERLVRRESSSEII